MKVIHIPNSYKVWNIHYMRRIINNYCRLKFNSYKSDIELNRSYCSMIIEWWLHNIGYYITKPFCFIDRVYKINLRCKDVDLEEWG